MIDIDYFEVKRKLNKVAGEAHTAVYGWVRGMRDGSPYTMDRCRDLGIALTAVMYYIKRDDSPQQFRLQKAMKELADLEQKCRDQGNRMPYE